VQLSAHPDDERLAVLRLNRPPLNALDQQMWDALDAVAQELHANRAFRAVVITGGPDQFAAGADIAEMVDLSPEEFGRRNKVLQGAFQKIATAPQITVAAINGYALGGGCELALAADFRVAGRRAALGLPEITLGIIPGSGGTQRLPRTVGLARARELVLSGRVVRAEEALQIGLVDQVVDDADVLSTATDLALTYARGPAALRHAKAALDGGWDLPVAEGLALEAELITEAFATEDAAHGLRSFLDDGPRRARFQGR
jgi:enoyl-CoA hydratase/carnithine racemase